ncbi:hypothetical protein BGZ60DRAFT_186075 [Tricladium varicosporioides]|nr:hypothetical protein BGZ60DRAFT_186075 [Hymenoscyphus varicosporioides]
MAHWRDSCVSMPGFGRPAINVPSQARKCHNCRINILNCNREHPSCSDCTQLGMKCQYPTTPPKSGSSCDQCDDLNITCNQEIPSCLSCAKLKIKCSYWPESTTPLGSTALIYQKAQGSSVATKPVTKTEATLLAETPRTACHNCRKRLIRCNKQWPNCLSCREKDIICRYTRKRKFQQPNLLLPTISKPETSKLEIDTDGVENTCPRCRRLEVKFNDSKPKCNACASTGRYNHYQNPESVSQQDSASGFIHWSQNEKEHAYDMYHMGVDQVLLNRQLGQENLIRIPKVDIQGPEQVSANTMYAMPQHFIGDFTPTGQQPITSRRVNSTLPKINKPSEEALFNIIPLIPESLMSSATHETIIDAKNELYLSKRETEDLVNNSSSDVYKEKSK